MAHVPTYMTQSVFANRLHHFPEMLTPQTASACALTTNPNKSECARHLRGSHNATKVHLAHRGVDTALLRLVFVSIICVVQEVGVQEKVMGVERGSHSLPDEIWGPPSTTASRSGLGDIS